MNIQNRLKKLESSSINNAPCFCGKTLVDMWTGKLDADALTYCTNCKPQFDAWANLADEAKNLNENLTDAGEIKQ